MKKKKAYITAHQKDEAKQPATAANGNTSVHSFEARRRAIAFHMSTTSRPAGGDGVRDGMLDHVRQRFSEVLD